MHEPEEGSAAVHFGTAAAGPPGRLTGTRCQRRSHHDVAVANRTGGGSLVGTEAAAEAPEDGPALLHTVVGHAALVGHAAPRALFPRGGIGSVGELRARGAGRHHPGGHGGERVWP